MKELFRTVVVPEKSARLLDHSDIVLVAGSCFAEHIGACIAENKFKCIVNPSGVLFNPLSICSMIERLLEKKAFTENDLFFHEGMWRSFDHHSSFSGPEKNETLEKINREFNRAESYLGRLDVLIITLGTSFVYFHKEQARAVANCHKLPHEVFERRLCGIDQTCEALDRTLSALRQIRPGLFVIMTVSPVRHLRDDPHENQISKAYLMSSIEKLREMHSFIHYFPAYEIMMDDLRDYRFYDRDMVHPSEIAIDYIWDAFTSSCISDRSQAFMRDYAPVREAMKHRIRNTSISSEFVQKNLQILRRLGESYRDIDLSEELDYFSKIKPSSV